MSEYKIGANDSLFYEHHQPENETTFTYVFFNALTGDTTNWEAVIGPILRRAGHGTLAYNMRGQANSPFSPDTVLDMDLIVDDAVRLLSAVEPVRPIFVGLSIGGLFAARTWLKGAAASGLVLINTLRKDGARLKWIGDALVRAVEVGGLEMFRDLFLPLLVNEEWLASNRDAFLKDGMTYDPLKPDSGHYKLLAEAGRTSDWNLPYEKLDLPVLVITGLQDHVFLERAVVDELANRLPKSIRSDMPNAGHLIPAEQPQALADVLLSVAKEVA
jgi:pimeloyl-ACP methyl ester carboxylesterase